MIARTWRGAVRTEDADGYLAYLEETGLAVTPLSLAGAPLRDVAGGLTRNVGVAAGVCERQTRFAPDVASGPFAVDIQRQRFRRMCITDARMSGVPAPDRSKAQAQLRFVNAGFDFLELLASFDASAQDVDILKGGVHRVSRGRDEIRPGQFDHWSGMRDRALNRPAHVHPREMCAVFLGAVDIAHDLCARRRRSRGVGDPLRRQRPVLQRAFDVARAKWNRTDAGNRD